MVTLVLLPGMDGTATLFAPFIQALANEFKIISVVYPQDQEMGYTELTQYVRAQLPCGAPYVLLGESFSGPIAIALASGHVTNPRSDPLLGLVLCCTFARNPRPSLLKLGRFINVVSAFRPPAAVLSYLLLGRFSTPALRKILTDAVAQVSPRVIRCRLAAVIGIDVSQQLAAVKVPVLSMSARQDRLVPQAASQLISELNPWVQSVQFDTPHCLLQTCPISAASTVVAFIRKLNETMQAADERRLPPIPSAQAA